MWCWRPPPRCMLTARKSTSQSVTRLELSHHQLCHITPLFFFHTLSARPSVHWPLYTFYFSSCFFCCSGEGNIQGSTYVDPEDHLCCLSCTEEHIQRYLRKCHLINLKFRILSIINSVRKKLISSSRACTWQTLNRSTIN